MSGRLTAAVAILIGVLVGCGETHFPAQLAVELEAIDDVRSDTGLDAQQKREALRNLGLDDVMINGILVSERLGNQFGGTLGSARQKVDAGRFSDLSPDEIQLFSDGAGVTTYTDADAQRIANMFADKNINTAEELTAYLDEPANELAAGIDEANLRANFIDFDTGDLIDQLP